MDTAITHQLCRNNKEDLKSSTFCGCFYCGDIYKPSEILEWCDKNGATAICPHCNVDSVLPDSKVELSKELLTEMHKDWFSLPQNGSTEEK